MNAAIFGRYFLDYALLYPSGFLCLACLWEKVRSPKAHRLHRGGRHHGRVPGVRCAVHDL